MDDLFQTFGPVWDGDGVRGFFGEGYWYHHILRPGLFNGSTFGSKTATAFPNKGNMALREDFTPKQLFPDCIAVNPLTSTALNAVGLSNPGIKALLATERWNAIQEPFFISFMPVGTTEEEQLAETKEFVLTLMKGQHFFTTRQLGIKLNISCPNVGADLGSLRKKAEKLLTLLGALHLPVVVKLNVLIQPHVAVELATHPVCSGICISNSIPFGELPDRIDWELLYPYGSPLLEKGYAAGGLSGHLLLPFVMEWTAAFRSMDRTTHLNCGGGIMRADDVDRLHDVGASSVFFSSVAMLRPWRVPSIIDRAHALFGSP